jgi:hypothetical protein
MFLGAGRVRQMTDEVAVQLVNVSTPEIVKLLARKAKHLVTYDYGDMDAFAVQYVAIHDRPPMRPPWQRCACWPAIARQIARYFPFAFLAGFTPGAFERIWRIVSIMVRIASGRVRDTSCLSIQASSAFNPAP